MYKQNSKTRKVLNINKSYIGETIEEKMRRVMDSKEPIHDSAPVIYTDRKSGVLPEHDIRTDRWDLAIDAMDAVHRTNAARREAKFADIENSAKLATDKKVGGPEPIDATGSGTA